MKDLFFYSNQKGSIFVNAAWPGPLGRDSTASMMGTLPRTPKPHYCADLTVNYMKGGLIQ